MKQYQHSSGTTVKTGENGFRIIAMIQTIPVEILAYCAGLIDGEGSIGIYFRPDRETFRGVLKVEMCDEAVIRFLHSVFGGSLSSKPVRRKNRSKHRPQWGWVIAAQQAAWCASQILPYLRVKKVQAENLVELQKVQDQIKSAAFIERARRFRVPNRLRSLAGHYNADPALLQRCRDLYRDQKVLNFRGVAA